MRAVQVELESNPAVLEIQREGGSAKRDVVVFVYGIEEASRLQVHVEEIPPAGSFRFEAGEPRVRRSARSASEPVEVTVELACQGGGQGEEGQEAETALILRLEYPDEEPERVRVPVIASANRVLPLWQILAEEFAELKETWREEIRENRILNDPEATDRRKLQEVIRLAHEHTGKGDGLAALCFSGGGIRSATYNLGTLQGLAGAGLLPRFDYVSSVSGGGYLSSWLAGWIHREGGVDAVAPQLAEPRTDPERPEPRPIRFLRQYSNYLTPKLGALSPDTWTLAAIVVRNLLLNLLVLVPLLAAALAIPLLALVDLPAGERGPSPEALYWAAVTAAGIGFFFMSVLRASRPESGGRWQGWFLRLGLLPLLAATALMAWAVAAFAEGHELTFTGVLRWCAILAIGMPVAAFGLAHLLQGRMMSRERGFLKGDLLSLGLSGAVVTFLHAGVLAGWAEPLLDSPYPLYPLFAPILFLGPLLLGKTLFVALSSYAEEHGYPSEMGDADREWWARWSGYMLIAAVAWMVAAAAVFFAPALLSWSTQEVSRMTAAGATGVLGWITSRLGQSGETSAKGSSGGWRSWALALAAPLFCLAVLLLVAALSQDLLRLVFDQPAVESGWWVPPFHGTLGQVLAAVAGFGGLGLVMGRFVNVNRFSLQAMYCNRLVRAYLGASHSGRKPNPFTGFDPADNLRLHELRSNRPWPVVNMALNLVAGQDLAWQQRKAESFTATPLHCGAAGLGYRRSAAYGGEDGISLGTAVATSGAAANPNMGYHSSPAVTFIMTVFNARLGAWLGNPGPLGAKSYTRGGPRSSALVLLAEALGRTDAGHPYVNLSDGGHFENLGIYEMVRRRCHHIVVGDAGCDPTCAFEDLGNAIRKVRIDLGIPIDFEERVPIFPKPEGRPEPGARYCAVGRVRYSAVDGPGAPDGILVYIKPALYEGRDEPYDVYNYGRSSPDFPHESTADQWFSESQFESYRALGKATLRSMVGQGPRQAPLRDLDELVENVREYLKVGSVVTPLVPRGERAAVPEPPPPLAGGEGAPEPPAGPPS